MKQLLLAGTTFLAIAASHPAARAVPFDFTYTGSLVMFMVPTTDTYQILAFGAQGGSGGGFPDVAGGVGGRGAEIGGNFVLTEGEILQIAVGGAGMSATIGGGGGGGGGSFVVAPGNMPLVIAGGGGGGGFFINMGPLPGQGGLTGPDGGSPGGGAGGTGGNGGHSGTPGVEPGNGGGGGGFFSSGQSGPVLGGGGGGGFPGLMGGVGHPAGGDGGFGGGGGGAAGAGGGGGYSGGGGGSTLVPFGGAEGGGGGSFDAGPDQILVADFQIGNGEVIITELAAVPEPASIGLLGGGLAGLTIIWRRRLRTQK